MSNVCNKTERFYVKNKRENKIEFCIKTAKELWVCFKNKAKKKPNQVLYLVSIHFIFQIVQVLARIIYWKKMLIENI